MSTQSAIKMLSIDDKSITTDIDRAGYRKMGVHVIPVTSFADAKLILAEQDIDIIAINYDYQKVDGVIVCKHLKSQGDTKDIPLVMTSVQANATVKNKCLGAGSDLFIEQPIPRQYFIEKIRTLLEQKIRENKRVTLDASVHVHSDGAEVVCEVSDLSRSGILLSTNHEFTAGKNIELTFNLPGYKKPVRIAGEVVRRIAPKAGEKNHGVGVRFMSYHGDSEKRLERYIVETQADDPKLVYYL